MRAQLTDLAKMEKPARLAALGAFVADSRKQPAEHGHETVVRAPKKLENENHRAFRDEVEAVPTRPAAVVLDCTGTTYINSAGLGTLVSLSKRMRERGQHLSLRGLNDDLLTLMDLCGLRRLLVEES